METTKFGAVTFTHTANHTGEVEISRAGTTVKVPFAAIESLVADKVRATAIANIEKMSPGDVLALSSPAAAKKK